MARSSPTTVVMVRTTPLTCGCHASVTIRMRCEGASGSISTGSGSGMRSGSLRDRNVARAEERQPVHGSPVDELHASVVVFDEGGAAFDPVAVVHVHDPVDLAHFGVMDVTANHAIETAAARLGGQRGLKTVDRFHRFLHLALQPR